MRAAAKRKEEFQEPIGKSSYSRVINTQSPQTIQKSQTIKPPISK